MNLAASVVIRTHNPNPERLKRVLEGLVAQTLSQNQWELLVIDNCSSPALTPEAIQPQPKNFRLIQEPQLGSSHAYARGFEEAAAELVVYVDDDTVPMPAYLETTIGIAASWPQLGAWGASVIEPEFETRPAVETEIYFKYLALRSDARDRWSNNPHDVTCIPFGPGLSMRRPVGLLYGQKLRSDKRRSLLGKIGKGLGASEDLDLALTAVDAGLGFGVFKDLRMTHLIPTRRVQQEYLDNLVFDIEKSEAILMEVREMQGGKAGRIDPLMFWLRVARANPAMRRLMKTRNRGRQAGMRQLEENGLLKTKRGE